MSDEENPDQYVEIDGPVEIEPTVQKPISEVDGPFSMHLREQIANGDINGNEFKATQTMGGNIQVEFDDGPTVSYSIEDLVSGALVAAQNAGYCEEEE